MRVYLKAIALERILESRNLRRNRQDDRYFWGNFLVLSFQKENCFIFSNWAQLKQKKWIYLLLRKAARRREKQPTSTDRHFLTSFNQSALDFCYLRQADSKSLSDDLSWTFRWVYEADEERGGFLMAKEGNAKAICIFGRRTAVNDTWDRFAFSDRTFNTLMSIGSLFRVASSSLT